MRLLFVGYMYCTNCYRKYKIKIIIDIVLTGLKKKIKQFEELFEQENGYKVRKKILAKTVICLVNLFLPIIIQLLTNEALDMM